jgi:hypothetical protein
MEIVIVIGAVGTSRSLFTGVCICANTTHPHSC